MKKESLYTTIGLMSGTSLDGMDAALIKTDGKEIVETLDFISRPYEDDLREKLRTCLGKTRRDDLLDQAEREMTLAHAAIVKELMSSSKETKIDLIGFHGQTVHHDPANRFTWQIGDGALLAAETGIDVICDFRNADVAAGGQGAPLIPLYHQALAADLVKPCVILNIGGVANVTYIGDNGALLAFDTGPGNALIDDWVKTHAGQSFDEDAKFARAGEVDMAWIGSFLAHPYFQRKPPKSLDRDEFQACSGKSLEEGAATLTALTVATILKAMDHFPALPEHWYVTGGGRHNPLIMAGLRKRLSVPVDSVDTLGWDGDALEAQGFAYLAVRSLLSLPLSLPTTTGVDTPVTGGVFYRG